MLEWWNAGRMVWYFSPLTINHLLSLCTFVPLQKFIYQHVLHNFTSDLDTIRFTDIHYLISDGEINLIDFR